MPSRSSLVSAALVGALLALVSVRSAARADEPAKEEAPATEGPAEVAPGNDAKTEDAKSDDEVRPAAKPAEKLALARRQAADAAKSCKVDDDCGLGSICIEARCSSIRSKRHWIPPFFWEDRGPRAGYRYVPPFYFQHWTRDKTEVSDTKVVPLLLFSRQTTPTRVADRLWPIFWHTRYLEDGKQVGSQTAMLPFFWWQEKKGHEHGAVPLLLTGWQRDPARGLTEALLLGIGYYRHDPHDVWRVLFPLYWDHEQQGTRIATLFPLFWYHRDGQRVASVLFPLIWRFTDEEHGSESLTLLPLFNYGKQHFGRRTRFVSWLAGYERDLDAKRTQLFLPAPPFYHRSDPSLSVDVLFPIFAQWRDHVRHQHGVVVGPLIHVADDDGATSTLFPIYWRFYDRRTQRQTHLVLPIGGFQQGPGVRGAVVGPAYGWSSENGEGGWGAGLAPIFFAGRSGPRHHTVLLPLFARYKDDSTGRSLTDVGPVFVRKNPATHGFDAGLLPLLFFGKEDQRAYAYLAPLLWFHKSPDSGTAVVGPAYWHHEKSGNWDGGLAPILFFGRRGERTFQVALPLFYRVASPGHTTTVVFPFVHDRDHGTTRDVLFPLLYVKHSAEETLVGTPIGGLVRRDGRAFGIIGPYIYRADEQQHVSSHVLFPLAFAYRSPSYDLTAILPVLWNVRSGTERDTLLFPLYWHRRGGEIDIDALFPIFLRAKSARATTFVVGPYYGRRVKDGWRQDGILGLFSYGEKREGDKVSRFLGMPGFFYQRNDFTGVRRVLLGPIYDWRRPDGYTSGLFPLVFAWRRGTESHAVTPIFYRQADRATGMSINVLGPLYWGRSAAGQVQLGLAPLFFGQYDNRAGNHLSKTVFFPLLYFAKKAVGYTLVTALGGYTSYDGGYKAVIGPIYVRRDRQTASEAVFPLFYHGKNRVTGNSMTYLFPLYFDRENSLDGTRLQAFTPLVWRYRSVEKVITIGFPLAFDAHNFGESRSSGFLPFFVRHRSEVTHSSWWSVPPLLMWSRERHGDAPGRDFVLFPFVWRFGGQQRSSTVVFPLVYDFKRGEDRTTVVFPIMARWRRADSDHTIVLNTYYRKGKGPRAGSWWLDVFPLFNFGRPRQQDWEWNVFEGLVGYSRQGRNRTLTLFWIIPVSLQPVPASNLSWWSNTPPEGRTSF